MRSVKGQRGFTLIEIIITIMVASIALFGLLGGISYVTSKSLNAEIMTTATELAQEKMEEKIAKKRASGYAASPDLDIGTTTENLSGTYNNYTRSVEICNVNASFGSPSCTGADNGSGYKRITVEVNYTGSLPNLPTTKFVTLVTVVANN